MINLIDDYRIILETKGEITKQFLRRVKWSGLDLLPLKLKKNRYAFGMAADTPIDFETERTFRILSHRFGLSLEKESFLRSEFAELFWNDLSEVTNEVGRTTA